MIELNQITLFNLNCNTPEESVKALNYSAKNIKFNKIILISNFCPKNLTNNINFYKIKPMTQFQSGEFSLREVNNYIDTDFQLQIHTDGFVINPQLWNNQFLQYDYIGAPWPIKEWCPINRVGNIGFSLKSKKFLQLCSKLQYNNFIHDDIMITNTYKWFFVKNGCKYAPVEVAMKFALQSLIPQCEFDLTKTFGFHGRQFPQCLEKIEEMHRWWNETYQQNER